jgi:hypothetical protein
MKRIFRIITFSALLPWMILAGADVPSPIRYSLSVSMEGFADLAPTGVAETVTDQRAPLPESLDLWKDCPHPQLPPCNYSRVHDEWSTKSVNASWKAFGPAFAEKAGRGFEVKTKIQKSGRHEGLYALVFDQDDIPRHTPFTTGRRLILAIPSPVFEPIAHDLSASWSSTLDPGDIALAPGYEIVAETFATVELTICSPDHQQCETRTVFEQAYPGDGEGGFYLPRSLFTEDAGSGQSISVLLYLEQRVSIGPSTAD